MSSVNIAPPRLFEGDPGFPRKGGGKGICGASRRRVAISNLFQGRREELMKRSMIAMVGVMILSFVLAHRTSAAEKVLEIGWMSALSGPAAEWGEAFKRIVDIQVEEYNAQGGILVGGERYKLKVIYEDDKFTADGGRAAAEKLVYQDKVKFILGSISSSAVLAQQKITEPNKVICMIDGQAKDQVSPNAPYSFRCLTGFREMTPAFGELLKERYPNLKKVAILNPNNDVGLDNQGFAPKMYRYFGLDVVLNELYPPATKDFATLLAKGLAAGAEVFDLGTSSVGSVFLMKKQLVELGFTGPTMNTASLPSEKFVQAVGAENVGNHFVFGYAEDPEHAPPKLLPIIEKYKQKHGSWFPVAARFPLFLDTLVRGIQAAGTVTDTAAIRDAIAKLQPFESAVGMAMWGGKETYGIDNQMYNTTQLLVYERGGRQVFAKSIPPERAKELATAIEGMK